MRFRSLAVAVALAAGACLAAPEASRTEIASRLQAQLPGIPPADYALGAAAFDAELREQVREHAGAGAAAVEDGKKAWNAKFRNGRSLSGCFPNGGRRVAATYPQYDPRLKRVITLEMAINQCLKSHNEPLLEPADPPLAAVVAYLRSLADGQKVTVRVPAAAEERFEQGRRLYHSRLGQRNFACASCHVQGAGRRYGEVPLSPAICQATREPAL